jgi:S1-C subfamily serine protease
LPSRSPKSLERGDLVMAIDGEVVHANGELQRALRRHPIGEAMPVQVVRSGRTEEIRVARISD